jgi:Glycosyltransferases, probably involved in cell wall biogenesis
MTISVLMSVYLSENADYFDASMHSVWTDQTMKPLEIVLIEDGPLAEEILDVIKKWEDTLGDKLVIVRNKRNLGLTKSLNRGLDVAHGELIARMDSDDISEPDRFERQEKYLREHPDIDIVGGSLREFNDSNRNLRVRHYPLTHKDALMYICKASPLAHPTAMMRKRMFDEGLRYNEKYRMSQDIALWFDAIMRGYRIANVPEVTINFRSQGDVFKRRSRAKAWNEFKIYMNGIYRINGLFTMKYWYPIARLCFRLMPPAVVKIIYGSSMRSKLLEE